MWLDCNLFNPRNQSSVAFGPQSNILFFLYYENLKNQWHAVIFISAFKIDPSVFFGENCLVESRSAIIMIKPKKSFKTKRFTCRIDSLYILLSELSDQFHAKLRLVFFFRINAKFTTNGIGDFNIKVHSHVANGEIRRLYNNEANITTIEVSREEDSGAIKYQSDIYRLLIENKVIVITMPT